MYQSRRKFITSLAAAGTAIPFVSQLKSVVPLPVEKNYTINLFSKPLDKYDFSFICECSAKSGISGLDLTVRPGGKVEPTLVDSLLPMLVKEAGRYNLTIEMIVTGIISAADPLTEKIIRAASGAGVKYYRLGWLEYDKGNDIWQTIQKYRVQLASIADLNRKYKTHGGYQNHTGAMVGGPVWDLHELFRDIPAEFLGSQYDVRHAMVEGADTWMLGMRLISGNIRTLAIKDFTWKTIGGKPQPVTVPMGEGMVDWDLYFRMVKELNIVAPITLHIEYPLLEKDEEKLSLSRQQEIIVNKIKKDVDFIKSFLIKYQLS
jgi:L-ribulose-5-phosphate 3-epimerase